MSAPKHQVESPYSGEIVFETALVPREGLDAIMARAHAAHLAWRRVPLAERLAVVPRFVEAFQATRARSAREISLAMGKPLKQAEGEIDGMIDRARQMAGLAEAALADEALPPKEGFDRWISREPVGVVVVIAAWNYPLLVAINATIAAVLAGNAVVLKHAPRTFRMGEQLAEAFASAGVPDGLVTSLAVADEVAEALVQHPLAGYVSFTGSVATGRKVYQAVARSRFIDVGLELGGKDPAYVTADVDFDHAVENVVDGAFYNAGQSCCAVERVYVEAPLYDRFVEAAVALARGYRMGDPLAEGTNLGPMALPGAPALLRAQVEEARSLGARILVGGAEAADDQGRGRFFFPTIAADTDRRMAIAAEESFGPLLALERVSGDEDALRRMNDNRYGLTASIWTRDEARARRLARDLEAGTVFMNRCDFLDPLLAWTGWKDSGKGASLSKLGFHAVTRPKSYHLRLRTA
jgi:acyl-CoA reductase-like NAD-dependent aldehyde dehydrogenase